MTSRRKSPSFDLTKRFITAILLILVAAGVGAVVLEPAESNPEKPVVNSGNATYDSDSDGLGNQREREIGTDPYAADTDGDGLTDYEEVVGVVGDYEAVHIDSADPLHKDIFVVIQPTEDHDYPDQATIDALKSTFANMRVSNPDGERGIDLHVREGSRINDTVRIKSDRLPIEHYREIDAQCDFYQVLITEWDGGYAGAADSPGYQSIVAAEDTIYNGRVVSHHLTYAHEILHNIVGTLPTENSTVIDGGAHTTEGILSHDTDSELSSVTQQKLNETGFAESDYYQEEVCR